jgi:ribonucleoside-diphosphate reductase alpha chain
MDDIIEHSDNSIRLANEVSRSNRKIGIGIMGWADVLAELNIPYDDEKAFSLASNVAQCIQESAVRASEDLANERGPFPNFTNSSLAKRGERPRRHATLTTIAPTGHISTLAGCSTASEPYFLAAYMREAAGRQLEVARPLKKKLQALNFSLREWINATKLTRPDYAFDGTLAYLSDEPTKYSHVNSALQQIKTVFRTSHEISPENHMRMVECFQKHTDNGISKTINLPQGASIADVRHVFELALERGLKGITIFRDKCLSEQALQTLPTCPGCGGIEALTPSACGGYDCSKELGGCGYAACELPLRRLI